MIETIKKKIKQIFCKHEYQHMRKINDGFMCISGEEIYIVCKKCGKIKGSYFRKYEGMGYR